MEPGVDTFAHPNDFPWVLEMMPLGKGTHATDPDPHTSGGVKPWGS